MTALPMGNNGHPEQNLVHVNRDMLEADFF